MYGNKIQEVAAMHNQALGRPASPPPAGPRRDPSVIVVANNLAAAVDESIGLLDQLENRLSSVLRNDLGPSEPASPPDTMAPPCGLAGLIGSKCLDLIGVNRRLGNILQQLEI